MYDYLQSRQEDRRRRLSAVEMYNNITHIKTVKLFLLFLISLSRRIPKTVADYSDYIYSVHNK